MDSRLAITLVLAVCMCASVQGCYVTGFVDINVMERFLQSDYVVYGQTTQHIVNELTFQGRVALLTDAVFDVHCILKGPDDMAATITISGISPRYACSGTVISDIMAVNDTAIIGLKKKSVDTYDLHEVMPTLSAAVIPYKLFFSSLSNLCGMQTWRSPTGANSTMCPICGTSDYTTAALTHPDTSSLQTCVYSTSQTVSDVTTCKLYLPSSVATVEAETCIPATYTQQCVTLQYRNASTGNCDCNRNSDGSIYTDGSEQNVVNIVLMMALSMVSVILI